MIHPKPRQISLLFCSVLFVILAAAIPLSAQKAERLAQVRKVYVESLGGNHAAVAVRSDLTRRLQKERGFQIVSNPEDADAILKGTAQIWVTGHSSLSPKSHSLIEADEEGYLSVQLIGRNNETLWSYLVMPSKFLWHGVADDLARQLAEKLTSAVTENAPPESSTASAPTHARAALKGAGATFPAPLYQQWFESFQESHPDVRISYEPVGSGEGIRRLQQREIDFGASDMPLTTGATSAGAMPDDAAFNELPLVVGAVVPIYNVAGLRQYLNFTPEILAGIYLGKIKKWDDPQIKKANPTAKLPAGDIKVFHRSDGSGTTYVWTTYLSKVNPEWRTSIGSGIMVPWPAGKGEQYNEGVAAAVQKTPNSIGYVEFVYAIQHQLSFAAVRNAAGEFVKANLSRVTEAARSSSGQDSDFQASIVDSAGKYAYPISAYTWILLPKQIADNAKKAALIELLRWMLNSGQRSCSALGYAPLPQPTVTRALQMLDGIQ